MTNALKWLNIIAFAATVLVNALANLIPLGGNTTGEVSAKYQSLFTPAPMTFSIWGLIYLMMTLFVIFQIGFGHNETVGNELREAVGPWFILSCLLNMAWIFCWHYDKISASLMYICFLLLTLFVINWKLHPLFTETTSPMMKLSGYGFQIYLGWICAATLANLSVYMVKFGWIGPNVTDQFRSVIFLIIGTIVAVFLIVSKQLSLSALTIVWAYIGILIRHMSASGYHKQYPVVIAFALICITVILLSVAVGSLLFSPIHVEESSPKLPGPKS